MTQDVISFVLRFIRETPKDEEPRWRGTISHVQSNTQRHFGRFAEVIPFIREQMGKEAGPVLFDSGPAGERNPSGADLARYQELVMESWLGALAPTTLLRQAFMPSSTPGQPVTRAEQEMVIHALENVTRRVEELNGQVRALEMQVASPTEDT
jgi:hypothetical protein